MSKGVFRTELDKVGLTGASSILEKAALAASGIGAVVAITHGFDQHTSVWTTVNDVSRSAMVYFSASYALTKIARERADRLDAKVTQAYGEVATAKDGRAREVLEIATALKKPTAEAANVAKTKTELEKASGFSFLKLTKKMWMGATLSSAFVTVGQFAGHDASAWTTMTGLSLSYFNLQLVNGFLDAVISDGTSSGNAKPAKAAIAAERQSWQEEVANLGTALRKPMAAAPAAPRGPWPI